VGTWQVSSDGNNIGGFHQVRMAKATDAMCYLVGLSGKFIGSGEYFYMDIEDGGDGPYWVLNVNAVDGSVSAMANCFSYYQQDASIHSFNPPPFSGHTL
jgi:hypothetical protein